jgi:uncharacterized membrane protein HdeD (DUF308 family)
MRDYLAKNWWVLLLRGLSAIAFGVLTFMLPSLTLATLVLLFGVTAIFGGVLDIGGAIVGRKGNDEWWLWLLQGVVGVLVGLMTFRAPEITTLALLFFIAMWSLAIGVLQVAAAIRLRKEIKGEAWLILSGVTSIALALILMSNPAAGALGLLLYIGAQAIVMGVVLVMVALRVRKLAGAVA